jgi:hypothetical protein
MILTVTQWGKIVYDVEFVLLNSFTQSLTGSHFYGTEYELRAGFGLVGNTGKKLVRKVCFF